MANSSAVTAPIMSAPIVSNGFTRWVMARSAMSLADSNVFFEIFAAFASGGSPSSVNTDVAA